MFGNFYQESIYDILWQSTWIGLNQNEISSLMYFGLTIQIWATHPKYKQKPICSDIIG